MGSSSEVTERTGEVGSVSARAARRTEVEIPHVEERTHALLRVACHDLGAPLNAMHLSAQCFRTQLARDGAPTREDILAFVARIERLASDAGRLVNDVLAVDPLARVDAAAAEVDANESLQGAIAIQAEALDRARSRIIVLREAERGALRGAWDKRALQSVFSNLLQNATRHAPGALITVRLSATESELVIRFSDQGSGRPDADEGSEQESSLGGRGHGLGMWIIRRAVARLGGTISFGKTSTGGFTVEIRVPPRRVVR